MTAKKKSSTDSQKIDRTYRRQIAMAGELLALGRQLERLRVGSNDGGAWGHVQTRLANIENTVAATDAKFDQTVKLLADHLTRVLRQNDTLRAALGQKEIAKLASANQFMGKPQ
jgi:hypothetical protein